MTCQICHTEHGMRSQLRKCKTCGRLFCIDCGNHESHTCCECLREDDTKHDEDFGILETEDTDALLEAVCNYEL